MDTDVDIDTDVDMDTNVNSDNSSISSTAYSSFSRWEETHIAPDIVKSRAIPWLLAEPHHISMGKT